MGPFLMVLQLANRGWLTVETHMISDGCIGFAEEIEYATIHNCNAGNTRRQVKI